MTVSMKVRLVVAALAGMLTIAIAGGRLYGVIFADLFASNRGSATGVMKSPPDLMWVGLAHVPFGTLLTSSSSAGAVVGAVLGSARPRRLTRAGGPA